MGFNPRSRMGSDSRFTILPFLSLVSTHAPAWGATLIPTIKNQKAMFQPTLPHGERLAKISQLLAMFVSTHAPAWGATNCYYNRGSCWCFNPRSRMGSDTGTIWPAWMSSSFNPRSRMGSDDISANGGRYPP